MLDPEQWAEVEELFARAAEMPAAERAGFIEGECADEGVRQEVRSLLEHASDDLVMVHAAIRSFAGTALADPLVGSWLGPYKIEALLGQGGMGAVYRAVREDDQFRKRVAIKLIPRVLAAPDAVARFRAERQILANLEHPNIARLLDGGTSEGIPYIVMEHVEGVPITEYVHAHDLPIRDRLRLMQSVCAAVQYAHRNLVVHRDLKPGNILVTADGAVKLLDFGLAKLIDPAREGPALTSRLMMMTPEYASPEQIQGAPVTTASDVYSLGVVLYEVLTGERPYKVTAANLQDLERLIATAPRKPSSVETLPARMRRRLAGDLDNIVLMALHKDVARRYGSVEALAEDIRRHLEGLPVQAQPDSVAYRAGKFVRRHRLAVASAALLALVLTCGVIAVLWEARQADIQRRRAEQRVGQLVELANRALFDVHGAIERLPGATEARKKIVATTLEYLDQLGRETGDDARVQLALASAYTRLGDIKGGLTLGSLGEWAPALATYQKALHILDPLAAREPRNPVYLLRRAQVSPGLWNTLMLLGKRPEASVELDHGTHAVDALLRVQTGDLPVRKLQEQLQLDRLAMLMEQDPPAAERDGLRLLPNYISLASEYPRDPDVLAAEAGLYSTLGAVAYVGGRQAESLRHYQQAEQLIETANRLRPQDAVVQRNLLRAYIHIAEDLDETHAGANAVRQYVAKGMRMAESLRGIDPSDFWARFEVANAYYHLGALDVPPSQIPASLKILDQARTLMVEMIAAAGGLPRFRIGLVIVDDAAGAKSRQLGRYGEALRSYRRAFQESSSLASQGSLPFADRELVTSAAEISELHAMLGERRETVEFAAKTAAAGQHILAASPQVTAQSLKKAGDAMAILARKPSSGGSRAADFEAARNYYAQAQQAWASLPETQRKTFQVEIAATAAALAACRR